MTPEIDESARVEVLTQGKIEVLGRITDASNATLLATAEHNGVLLRCVYKPSAGERPLWDFPSRTLAHREVAAYQVSHAGGWDLVPVTVLREGPLGVGSVQLWIEGPSTAAQGQQEGQQDEPDVVELASAESGLIDLFAVHELPTGWCPVVRARDFLGDAIVLAHADDDALRDLAVFDVVCDNADRKGAHVLAQAGRIMGIDNGLTFNIDDKLRTVLWGWAGERLRENDRERLARVIAALRGGLGEVLMTLLDGTEVRRTTQRVEALMAANRMPRSPRDRPAIPWPPL